MTSTVQNPFYTPDSQVDRALAGFPDTPPSNDSNEPLSPFPTSLELSREQEGALVDHVINRCNALEDELGRVIQPQERTLRPTRTPGRAAARFGPFAITITSRIAPKRAPSSSIAISPSCVGRPSPRRPTISRHRGTKSAGVPWSTLWAASQSICGFYESTCAVIQRPDR